MNYISAQISPETMFDLVPQEDGEGQYSEEFRSSLLRGFLDIRRRRTHKLADVKKNVYKRA